MKTLLHKKSKALLLLLIIAITNIGLPVITHQCNHEDLTEISIFSSEEEDHSCKTSCCSIEEVSLLDTSLSFNKTPCCSYETNILNSDLHLASNAKVNLNPIFTLILKNTYIEVHEFEKTYRQHIKSNNSRLYGLEFRIAIQSFLC